MTAQRYMSTAASALAITACAGRLPILRAASHLPTEESAYVVKFDSRNPRSIHVDAELAMVNDTLRMSSIGATQLIDGWATFVHNVVSYGPSGPMVPRKIGGGKWLVAAWKGRKLMISYDVGIAQDTIRWNESGAFARGYAVNNAVFFAGRAVFIVPAGADDQSFRIDYDLPPGWSVATPYQNPSGNGLSFRAINVADLWVNANLVGRLETKTIAQKGLVFVFAGTPEMGPGLALFANTMTPVLAAYDSIIGNPPRGKFFVAANISAPGPRASHGGETFRRSISLLVPQVPDISSRPRWGYLLAHEAFHLWNQITPADPSSVEWFTEGFTDYIAKVVAYRTGVINQDEFLNQLAIGYSQYLRAGNQISLREAGSAKGANYGLIYFGGMTAALALDIELRTPSSAVGGVPEMLRRANQELRGLRPFSYDDLVRVAGEVGHADFSPFFKKYISGKELIPLPGYLALVGVSVSTVNDRIVFKRVSEPTPAQRVLFESLVRH